MTEDIKREPVVLEEPVIREPIVTELPVFETEPPPPPSTVTTDYVVVDAPVPAGVLTTTTSEIVLPATTETDAAPVDPYRGAPMTVKIVTAIDKLTEVGDDFPTTEQIVDFILDRDMTPKNRKDPEAVKVARKAVMRRFGDLVKSKRIIGTKEDGVLQWYIASDREGAEHPAAPLPDVNVDDTPTKLDPLGDLKAGPVEVKPKQYRKPVKGKSKKAKARAKAKLRPTFPFSPKQCREVLEDIMPAFLAWPNKRRAFKNEDLLCDVLSFIEKVGKSET